MKTATEMAKCRKCAAHDLWLGDLFELELEPDGKEQHQNAQMGDVVERFAGVFGQAERWSEDVDGKARSEEPDEGRQADLAHGEAEKEGETDGDDFEQGAKLSCVWLRGPLHHATAHHSAKSCP